MRLFKPFQVRWNEPIGNPECPYCYRWVLNLFLFSIRIHKWLGDDDKRYMHDHPWPFITIVLKGKYIDASEKGKDHLKTGSIRYRRSIHKHNVTNVKPGTITLVITGPKIRNWGYWVDGRLRRPLKYFHKYGHSICEET